MTNDTNSIWTSKEGLEALKQVLTASLYDESAWQLIEGPMEHDRNSGNPVNRISSAAKRQIVSFLRARGLALVRVQPYREDLRKQGLDWPLFGYTMIGRARMDNIHDCIDTIVRDGIAGDLIETGVWRGGATILMKAVLQHHGDTTRQVWCADSFEGLPPPNNDDLQLDAKANFSDRSFLSVSQEQVAANFTRFGLLDSKVRFLKGWFSDTLPNAPIKKIALLRMDGDLYESTMDALTNLYPKITPGGFLIIDDYYSWKGCRTAVDEYRHKHAITAPLQKIDSHSCFWRVEKAAD